MSANAIDHIHNTDSPLPHAVLVLAAGESKRLGQPKQLLTKQGIPLVRYIVAQALKTHATEIVVVVGAEALKMGEAVVVDEAAAAHAVREALAGLAVKFAVNPAPSRGMASSLWIGAAALHHHRGRILILGIDQPRLSSEHLQRLLEAGAAHPEDEIASAYDDTVGLPVLISAKLLARSHELKGDMGLKGLLQARPEHLVTVSLPELEFDVDDRQDIAIAQKNGWMD